MEIKKIMQLMINNNYKYIIRKNLIFKTLPNNLRIYKKIIL